jgi:hypothetical protein
MHYAYGTILFNSTWKLETSDFILLAIFTTANLLLLLLFYYYFAVYVMRHDDDGKTVAKLLHQQRYLELQLPWISLL